MIMLVVVVGYNCLLVCFRFYNILSWFCTMKICRMCQVWDVSHRTLPVSFLLCYLCLWAQLILLVSINVDFVPFPYFHFQFCVVTPLWKEVWLGWGTKVRWLGLWNHQDFLPPIQFKVAHLIWANIFVPFTSIVLLAAITASLWGSLYPGRVSGCINLDDGTKLTRQSLVIHYNLLVIKAFDGSWIIIIVYWCHQDGAGNK